MIGARYDSHWKILRRGPGKHIGQRYSFIQFAMNDHRVFGDICAGVFAVAADAAHRCAHQYHAFDGDALRPGHRLVGPLIVEEPTTTAFIGVGEQLEVDAADNLVVRFGAPEAIHGA